MYGTEIIKYLEEWAPPEIAWKNDNVGLQVGSKDVKIKNILIALELNEKVLEKAIKTDCNFIFTHHPFIFTPIKNLDISKDSKAKIISQLIKNDITLYCAHTNLDFTKYGMSFELAEKLQLTNIEFLTHEENNQYKLVIFIPIEEVDNVAEAIFKEGGGIIGEYYKCSNQVIGEGTFQGSGNSNPTVGSKGQYERVVEIRLEVLVDSWKLDSVIKAIQKSHPYEEPAYDIYPLKNKNTNFGAGAVGNLKTAMTVVEFLSHVKKSLKADAIRFTPGKKGKIKNVAVCGGSGSDLLEPAVKKKADAFITADIKYHTFQDAENRILLIDAGHYETEVVILNAVKKRLSSLLKDKKSKVYIYNGSTNPIKFYNN